jgi:hypothetical protein
MGAQKSEHEFSAVADRGKVAHNDDGCEHLGSNMAGAEKQPTSVAGDDRAAAMTSTQAAEDVETAGETGGGERWNSSRLNICRYLAVNWSFVVIGMNDACIGVSPENPAMMIQFNY